MAETLDLALFLVCFAWFTLALFQWNLVWFLMWFIVVPAGLPWKLWRADFQTWFCIICIFSLVTICNRKNVHLFYYHSENIDEIGRCLLGQIASICGRVSVWKACAISFWENHVFLVVKFGNISILWWWFVVWIWDVIMYVRGIAALFLNM